MCVQFNRSNKMLTVTKVLIFFCFVTIAKSDNCKIESSANVHFINCDNIDLNSDELDKIPVPKGNILLNIRNCTGDITKNSFKNLRDIYSFTLNNCHLNTFILPPFTQLKDLDIKSSVLPKTNKHTWHNVKGLRLLTLRYNKMEIEPNSFNELTDLVTLVIEKQHINFDENFLKGLSNLDLVDLADVGITEIKKGTFKDNIDVEDLRLDGNPIQSIESGAFDSMQNLQRLSVSLENLDIQLLKELKKLETIRMPAKTLKNLDLKKLLETCPSVKIFDFKIEDCGKPEIDELQTTSQKLGAEITIKFEGFDKRKRSCEQFAAFLADI